MKQIQKSSILNFLDTRIRALVESDMSASGDFRKRAERESPERYGRAKGLYSKIGQIYINEDGQLVIPFHTISSGNTPDAPPTYENLILIPGLTQAYQQNPAPATIVSQMKNSDVKVKCNCKDFKFRFEHWLNRSGDLVPEYDDNGNRKVSRAMADAPNITNPANDKGPFCKHLIMVTSIFLTNLSTMKKQIRLLRLGDIVENEQVNDARAHGMIELQKDSAKSLFGVIGEEEPVAQLEKDSGLTEEERTQVEDVFLNKEIEIDADVEVEPEQEIDIEDDSDITDEIIDEDESILDKEEADDIVDNEEVTLSKEEEIADSDLNDEPVLDKEEDDEKLD